MLFALLNQIKFKAVNNFVKRWTLSDILCNVNGTKKDLLVFNNKRPAPPLLSKKINKYNYIYSKR